MPHATTHTSIIRRGWAAALVLVLATMSFALAGPPPAEAAGCCSVKREGSQLVITGTVPYRGAKYITSGIVHEDGWGLGAVRCAAKASGRNAYVKMTIPIKYVPNGVYMVDSASANSDYTRYYQTKSDTFRVRNSPAVRLAFKRVPAKLHRSDSATFGFETWGAVRKTQCQFDGQTWRNCPSPKTYSGLSEGRHVVRVRALGGEGLSDTRKRVFRVDTLPPTPPKLDQDPGYYVVRLTAYGSRDAGTRVVAYEYQTFQNGEPTSPIVRSDWVDVYGDENPTVVKFRALDRAGRRSAWTVSEPINPRE